MSPQINPSKYLELVAMRDRAKNVTQLSYNLAQLEKMYPFDSLNNDTAEELIGAYEELLKDVLLLEKLTK